MVTVTIELTLKDWDEKRTLQLVDQSYWRPVGIVIKNEIRSRYLDLWSRESQEGALNSHLRKVMNVELEMSNLKEFVNLVLKTGCNARIDQFLKR